MLNHQAPLQSSLQFGKLTLQSECAPYDIVYLIYDLLIMITHHQFPILQLLSRLALSAALIMSCSAASAQAVKSAPKADPEIQRITRAAEQLLGAQVESIAESPVEGLYELIINGSVYYIDKSGKRLIDGQIIDLATRSSLTAKRKLEYEAANNIPFDAKSLNFADAIKTVHGTPTPGRVIVAFEDPRCGYCKKLHQDLEGMKDLVVYTFPVSFLGPESRSINEAIQCSSDRTKAWATAMKGGPVAPAAACNVSALDRNTELARKYRVKGTPTMFLADGKRIVGAVGAAEIEMAIQNASVGKIN